MQYRCRLKGPAMVGAPVRTAPPLAADILVFQPGDGLVEPLGAVAVACVVGGMAEPGIGNLALQLGKMLKAGLRQIGEVECLILLLLVEAFEGGPAVDELSEMLLDLGLRGLGLQESDALEGARPVERLEQPSVAAPAHELGEALARDAMVVEDGLGEEAEKLGKSLLPDVEMRHLLGEMIEQRRMMGERENDGDGEAMG